MIKLDHREHSPAAKARPFRHQTTAIVVHHLGVDVNKDGITTVGEAIDFFVRDPEGIATVALSGGYAGKLATIQRWRRDGVPAVFQGRGYVPYHFLVDEAGVVHRMLVLEAVGAHAGNVHTDWNAFSVGVACLGDFEKRAPSDAEVAAVVALLGDIRTVYPEAEIFGHDETLERDGLPAKGCPGRLFPLEEIRSAVRGRPQ
jgi:hypothetical protein